MPSGLQVAMALSGNLRAYDRAVMVSATVPVRTVTSRMKAQGRRQMERAGLGTRLPNAFRGKVTAASGADITKRGIDANPTGVVASNALVKRAGGAVDLIEVFQTGAVAVPHHGNFLAMPTREAGGRHAKPMASYAADTFRLIPYQHRHGPNPPSFLAIHKQRKEVWYLLFPSVRIRKRLDLLSIYERQAASVVELHARAWQREVAKLERKL
jgi:hypothetical protein